MTDNAILHARLTRIIRDESRQLYANETDRTDALAAAIIDALQLTEEKSYNGAASRMEGRLVGPWIEESGK